MSQVKCNKCDRILDEPPNCSVEYRAPCPICGSLGRKYSVRFEGKVIVRDGLGLKARHPESRRPFYESYRGPDKSRKTGKFMKKERIIDRENDHYYERVEDYDTEEVVHHCEEPLSLHIGHGNAKKK